MPKLPSKFEDWTPPWTARGEAFDEDKAARLIFNAMVAEEKANERTKGLRAENAEIQTKLDEAEAKVSDKPSGDPEKDKKITDLTAELTKLRREGRPEDKSLIERFEVAIDKGLSANDARRLVGNTRDELEADAEDLAARLGVGKKDEDGKDGEGEQPPSRGVTPASQLGNGRNPGGAQTQTYSVDEILAGKSPAGSLSAPAAPQIIRR